MNKPFQRKGSTSNAAVGKHFEMAVKTYFTSQGLKLQEKFPIKIGINGKKLHNFDLIDPDKMVLIECKSSKWTEGSRSPSAKMSQWNEAMYYFYASPRAYRKIFCVLKDHNAKHNKTLAQYYIYTYLHMIPKDVEVWEFDDDTSQASRLV